MELTDITEAVLSSWYLLGILCCAFTYALKEGLQYKRAFGDRWSPFVTAMTALGLVVLAAWGFWDWSTKQAIVLSIFQALGSFIIAFTTDRGKDVLQFLFDRNATSLH